MRTAISHRHVRLILLALVMACGFESRASAPAVLADAAEQADWPRVRSLLNDHADVNAAQPDGTTALHWAAHHDDLDATKLLLVAGASAKAANRYGVTPLAPACTNGDADLIKALLAAGADANATLRGGETALMTAARTGRPAAVRALLAAGAKVDAADAKGQTALMWAAADGHAEVGEILVKAGADPKARLKSGFTPMLFAAREGRTGAVRALLKAGVDANEAIETDRKGGGLTPRTGVSALTLAVENAHFELALELVKAGADPNDQRSGYTPLHTLTWVRKPNRGDDPDGQPPPTGSGNVTALAFARELVTRGAKVNARLVSGPSGRGKLNGTGATPFLMAARTADLPYLKLLVELGADPRLANKDGCTPLMAAAGIGTLAPDEEAGTEPEAIAAAEYLLTLGGADVNAVDQNGETAMHGAAYKSLPKMVQFLADHGAKADVWNKKDKYGWTPLLIAQGYRPGNFKPSAETIEALQAVLLAAAPAPAAPAAPLAPAGWVRQDNAVVGPTRPTAFVYAPTVGRWMTLGYQFPPGNGKRKPATYDELAFDPAQGQWENWFPPGKDWGPKFGDATAPPWKGERGGFKDVEGNVRPNWMAWYWLLGAGHNYCWDPDDKRFLFYIDGKTFSYDPVARAWKDLAATGDPQTALSKSQMLWGSICYDAGNKRVVLFGGGNAQTPRGDVGTWTYTPATNAWAELKLDVQPPARANSALVYDPANKRVVLFGGDRLNELLADTWTFDGTRWEERKPAIGPSPRAGHALVWLPKAQRVLLLGGYAYTSSAEYQSDPTRGLPLEAWTYDVAADRWELVQRLEPVKKGTPPAGPSSPGKFIFQAAVDDGDSVAALDANRELWTWSPATFAGDAAATAARGVKPGTVARRDGSYDPAWYSADIPAADATKVEAELAAIPPNRWVRRTPPKQPKYNSDWGSAIYCADTDEVIRFSGGHSAYSGTAPHVYDIKTDRWSMPFAPEIPVEFTYANDGVPGEHSFGGNPWMTGHTYKSLGYDPNLKGLVFGPHKHTYLFDPRAGKWSQFAAPNPYTSGFYTLTLIPTPSALVAWANGGTLMWRLNAESKTWESLPVKGKIFAPICDNAGMTYDAKRDRMLAFAWKGKTDTVMFAYDLKTGEATTIEAAGAGKVQDAYRASAGKGHFEFRESVYLPDLDMVMNGATGLFYDCAKNAWLKAAIPSDAPDVTKHPAYNLGVMYDPKRKLVWAVDTNFNLYVLHVDLATLKMEAL